MHSTLGNRIASVRKTLGLTQDEFAEKLGMKGKMTISGYERDLRNPEYDTLIKIADLGKVTLDWLLTGQESSFTPPITDLNDLKGSEARISQAQFYPLIDKVTAGDYSVNVYPENIVQYYPVNYHRKNCFLVEVEGDSMICDDADISIPPGDLLLVDPVETVSPGDIVVVKLTNTRHMVKQFFKNGKNIELKSYNPGHPSIYIDEDQIEYIFRVVYHQPKGKKR